MSSEIESSNFISEIIDAEIKEGKHGGKVITRFPPEPNGYLHIGHAKSIAINFGLAKQYKGQCNLRFDDTNPEKEESEYVESIKKDVSWLGYEWGANEFYASDNFDKLYEFALILIKNGKAYVDYLSADEIREYRGTLTKPGKESPFRDRPIDESIDLLERMKNGEFDNGQKVLRAKIDMSSGNINMRDPVMYRILRSPHHRTGDKWCIYPMYDWAHGQSDSMEGVTNSICTLEFEDHRPLYDWFLDALDIHHPRQTEFARLNLSYTVLSKRKLMKLVTDGHVSSWDDPRMPTISGLRRRGYTAQSIRTFCERIGVAKKFSTIDLALLEHCLREDLNPKALRVMAVLNPLKLIIENYPEGKVEDLPMENNPEDPEAGTRMLPFSREIYIEQNDFMEDAPKKFFRLAPGREVRLKGAYIIKCESVIKDDAGNITELRCTHDPESKSGMPNSNRKVKGTLHWVSAPHAIKAETRLYDTLFTQESPEAEDDFTSTLNPSSLQSLSGCMMEPGLKDAKPGVSYQFLRLGYFCLDSKDSSTDAPVFNRTVTLRDTWAKMQKSVKKQ